jgi:hypothetical protein
VVRRGSARDDGTRPILSPGRAAGPRLDVEVPPAPGAGLERTDLDVLGPEGVFVLVSTTTGKDDIALQAADGWAGDRLARYEDGAGRGVTLWTTRWRDASAARDAEYVLRRVLGARFGDATKLDDGTLVFETSARVARLSASGDEIRVRISDPAFDVAAPAP